MDAWAKSREKAKQDAIDKAKANGTIGSDGLPPKNEDDAKTWALEASNACQQSVEIRRFH